MKKLTKLTYLNIESKQKFWNIPMKPKTTNLKIKKLTYMKMKITNNHGHHNKWFFFIKTLIFYSLMNINKHTPVYLPHCIANLIVNNLV